MKHSDLLPQSDKMTIIRIAPVCNGKIYVIPRSTDGNNTLMDLPIEEAIEQTSEPSNRIVCKIKEKYNRHIQSIASPRFSVKYSSPHQKDTVYLYILPLQGEDEIHFQNGKFIEAGDITSNSKNFTLNLQEEGELLGMAAELWNDYMKKGVLK